MYTNNSIIPLFFGRFQQFTHHFNENCLKILIFYSKLKFDHYSLIGIVFKVQNQKLAPVRSIFFGFQRFAPHYDENCLTYLDLFWKKNKTFVAQTATILVCVIKFLRQNWAGWMIHRVIFLGGPYIYSLLCVGTLKALYWWPWQIWPRPGDTEGKNLNCIKTRAYLANKRISIHS